jgi:hypothetical protein
MEIFLGLVSELFPVPPELATVTLVLTDIPVVLDPVFCVLETTSLLLAGQGL